MLTLFTLLILLISGSPAYAKTPKPTLAQIETARQAESAKRAAANSAALTLAQANASLRALASLADKARAKYSSALSELSVTKGIAKVAAQHAQLTASAVVEAHRTIGKLAVNAYMLGGGLTDIEPLLSSRGPQDLVEQISTLSNLGARNSTALDRYSIAETAARAAKEQADNAKIAQQSATDKVAVAKASADAAKAAQQSEVDKLQKVQDEIMRELASAKKVRITLEQQRQLALLEEAKAKEAANTPGQKSIWPDRGFKGRANSISSETQRLAAVAYAKKQVLAGKPYVWGAQGPSSFDCSGLVYSAYKSAGLGWPIWSRLNAALYSVATKHITLAQLQPGDLLFYSFNGEIQNIHHMAIYAGNGMVWEARSTKSGLRFSNMYGMPGLMPFGGRV